MKINDRKGICFLGTNLDFSKPLNVALDIKKYVDKMIEDFQRI